MHFSYFEEGYCIGIWYASALIQSHCHARRPVCVCVCVCVRVVCVCVGGGGEEAPIMSTCTVNGSYNGIDLDPLINMQHYY